MINIYNRNNKRSEEIMKVDEKESKINGSIATNVDRQNKKTHKKLKENLDAAGKTDNPKKERDVAIDLIRVVACIIVIATHMALTTYNIYEVQVDWSRLFTKSFLADGVGLFFLITGFFLANGRSYKRVIGNTFKKIVLPSFIVLVFAQVFYKFLINQETFMNCIRNFGMDNIKTIMSAILHGEVHQTIPVAAHLWYIFDYVKIMIIFPVLQLLCKDEKENKLARRILMILAVLNIFIKDIQKFFVLSIGEIEVFSILDPKLLMVLLGYELYLQKDKIKNNRKCTIIGLVIFAVINIFRYKAEMQYMIMNQIVKEEAFISWDTIFGVISTIALFIALYTLDIKNKFLCKTIPLLGSMTFGIYLVHFLIIAKIDLFKFEKISTVKFEMLYMFLGTLIIFILSYFIVLIIKLILKLLKVLMKNKFYKLEEQEHEE